MKRLKLGFTALIAVLAMSFTVVSHQGAFKTKHLNSKLNYTCSTTSDAKTFFYCNSGTRTEITTSTPAANIPATNTCTFGDVHPGTGITCDETQTYFCCFQQAGSTCSKPTCALPGDAAGYQLNTIHYNSFSR